MPKVSTSPFSVTVVVDQSTIRFNGTLKEWSRSSDSGNKSIAKFCPDCGNRVYHLNPEQPSFIKLKLKPVNIADANAFKPTVHIWVSEKTSWYDIPKGIPVVEKQP